MTIRELISILQEFDEDIKDYKVFATFSFQLNDNVRMTGKAILKEIPENVDVAANRIYLKFREEL